MNLSLKQRLNLFGLLQLHTVINNDSSDSVISGGQAAIIGEIMCLTGGTGLAVALLLMMFRRWKMDTQPMERLIKSGSILKSVDGPALTSAVTELAQGNLSVKVNIKSSPLKIKDSKRVRIISLTSSTALSATFTIQLRN